MIITCILYLAIFWEQLAALYFSARNLVNCQDKKAKQRHLDFTRSRLKLICRILHQISFG